MTLLDTEKDHGNIYCELIDQDIQGDHPFFRFESHCRMAIAYIGLAISCGTRLAETRELLEIIDTLYNNLSNPEEKLQDQVRKKLNHEDDVWLDMKQKFSSGDARSSYLILAHAGVKLALSDLVDMRKDSRFTEFVSDYLLNYMYKLSVALYREAIGHVLL